MDGFLDILSNKFFVTYYAVLVWFAFILVIEKQPSDEKNGDFKVKWFLDKYWDNMLLTTLFAPLVVIYDEEGFLLAKLAISKWTDFQQGSVFHDLIYITAGFQVSIIIIGIKKLREWAKKFKTRK